MKADSGRKYRAYPDLPVAARLESWGHTCRWIYNIALEQRAFLYQQRGIQLNADRQCAQLTQARKDLSWVADLPAQCGQQVLRHLDQAFKNWWNPQHRASAPARKKRATALSVTFPGQAITVRRVSKRWGVVVLPKVGAVRFRWSRDLGGTVRSATLTLHAGVWHVAFGVHTGHNTPTQHTKPGTAVGVDRGVTVPLALSDGRRWGRPHQTAGQGKHLARLRSQAGRQETARRKTGACTSRRAKKIRTAIGRAMWRQTCRRHDHLHWAANRIAVAYELIGIERLAVQNMTASAKGTVEAPGTNVAQKAGLNRAILDKGWHTFKLALHNQARKTGTRIVEVPAPYTSQRCRPCGHVDAKSRKSQADFACTNCGHRDHADLNAAGNIEDDAVASSGFIRGALGEAARKVPRRPPGRCQTRQRPRKSSSLHDGEDVNDRSTSQHG